MKRIGTRKGCLFSGYVGQIKKWYGWVDVIEFDSKDDAVRWLNS